MASKNTVRILLIFACGSISLKRCAGRQYDTFSYDSKPWLCKSPTVRRFWFDSNRFGEGLR